jgi:anti-sigma factor RsiW
MNHTCKHTELVSSLIDGELSPDEAAEFEDHLLVCHVCREERDALKELSSMFSVFRDAVPPIGRADVRAFPSVSTPAIGIRKAMSVAAMVMIGLGALISLAPDLSEQELRFESYLDRSLDEEVLEMTSLFEGEISRDQVVGLLISSFH